MLIKVQIPLLKRAHEHVYMSTETHAPPTYPPGGIPHMDEMSDGMLLQVDNGYYMQPDIYEELSGNLSKPSLHLQAAQPAGRGMFHQEERQKYRSWEKWKLAASPETSSYFIILWGDGGAVKTWACCCQRSLSLCNFDI